MAIFNGTSGKDRFDGTVDPDTFNMEQGGNDKVFGLDGDDIINFGAALTHKDKIDGGIGADLVFISGDYSAGIVFDATTMTGVETIGFGAGFSYNLTLDDANMVGFVTIDGRDLGVGDSLIFDGTADTDANFSIWGGDGDDILATGAGDDNFQLSLGGSDDARGGEDTDTFMMGGAFDVTDRINGGVGVESDFMTMNGDYSAGLSITKNMMKEIELLLLQGDFDYNLTLGNKVAANGQGSLSISVQTLNDHGATIDASAERNARVVITDGTGDDVLTGGDADDLFNMDHGGDDRVFGGDGADIFDFGATVADARVDGGDGEDTIILVGDYSAGLVFSANDIGNVEEFTLGAGHSYSLTMHDGNVAAGEQLTVGNSLLTASDTLTFDGGAELDGWFLLNGGAGDDELTGGAMDDDLFGRDGADVLSGHEGADHLHGGDDDDRLNGNLGDDLLNGAAGTDRINGGFGIDTYQLIGVVAESTSTTHDTWVGFNFNQDKIDIAGFVNDVDPRITTGALNMATFDDELGAIVDGNTLGASNAVLFTANGGDLSGHTYLVIDRNSTAGYQIGADFVVEIEGGTNLNGLGTGDFI